MSEIARQMALVAMLTAATTVASAQPVATGGTCSATARATLQRAAADVEFGEFEAADAAVREAHGTGTTCAELSTASWSWYGWQQADAAASRGGAPESLVGARAALDVLAPDGRASGPGNALAAALVQAAVAAAQDERAEMRVWLEHADGLGRRLLAGQSPWPMAPAVAEGELWLRLRDYELAEAAFSRALGDHESPVALRGLARARARRGDPSGGCAPFRRALTLIPPDRASGALALEATAFLRLCK